MRRRAGDPVHGADNANLPPEVLDRIPDVRDGLTRVDRIVLWQLGLLEKERGGRMVPTAQLYGRVVEHVMMTPEELSNILARLGARKG